MKRITFALGGMSRGRCVGAVHSALAQIGEVAVEQVRVGSAAVAFDPKKDHAGRDRRCDRRVWLSRSLDERRVGARRMHT